MNKQLRLICPECGGDRLNRHSASQLTGDALLASRRARQQPVWDQMRAELDSVDDRTKQVILPKSDLRKALNYVRNHWTELTRYLGDAELPPDNNSCEQLMRDVAVGRKNWSAPDVLSRPSGQRKAQDALLAIFETLAV
jgi:malate synthase